MTKIVRLTLVLVIALTMIGGAFYTLFLQSKVEEDTYVYKEAAVEFGDLQVGIMESGSIETEAETQKYKLDLVEDSEGDTESTDDDVDISESLKFEEVYAVVGQRIKAGDPIYKLKESSVANVRKKLVLEAAEAETTLAEAQLSCSLDTLDATHTAANDSLSGSTAQGIYELNTARVTNEVAGYYASIKESYANIDSYRVKTAEYQADDDHDGISNDEEVRQSYENKKKDYDNADKNNERTFVTIQQSYLEAKDNYDSMLEDMKSLNDKIADENDTITDYLAKIQNTQTNAATTVLAAKQTYETDTLAGNIAQNTYGYAVGSAEEAVSEARSNLEEANEKLTEFNSFAGDGTIYAENDGMITEVNYESGDVMESTSDLFSYVTESSLTLSVDVSQEDVVDIEVGDGVTIQFTAYPDENYEGTVTAITTTATSDYAATVSYPVTIKVMGDTSKLYAGMTGDVTFVTEEQEQVVYVSRKAIVEQNGKSYVYQKDKNQNMILTPVTTGFTDGINVEITEGLAQGDSIYIASKVTKETEGRQIENNE